MVTLLVGRACERGGLLREREIDIVGVMHGGVCLQSQWCNLSSPSVCFCCCWKLQGRVSMVFLVVLSSLSGVFLCLVSSPVGKGKVYRLYRFMEYSWGIF